MPPIFKRFTFVLYINNSVVLVNYEHEDKISNTLTTLYTITIRMRKCEPRPLFHKIGHIFSEIGTTLKHTIAD